MNAKEKIQYGLAALTVISGIALTFLCFFLNHYQISDGVLWYVAQTLVYSGSIFGVTIYIQSKMGEVKNYIKETIKEKEECNGDK